MRTILVQWRFYGDDDDSLEFLEWDGVGSPDDVARAHCEAIWQECFPGQTVEVGPDGDSDERYFIINNLTMPEGFDASQVEW